MCIHSNANRLHWIDSLGKIYLFTIHRVTTKILLELYVMEVIYPSSRFTCKLFSVFIWEEKEEKELIEMWFKNNFTWNQIIMEILPLFFSELRFDPRDLKWEKIKISWEKLFKDWSLMKIPLKFHIFYCRALRTVLPTWNFVSMHSVNWIQNKPGSRAPIFWGNFFHSIVF